MRVSYRQGLNSDLAKLKQLAVTAWSPFQNDLTPENWGELSDILSNKEVFLELLRVSQCIVCETVSHDVVGMAFLVPKGNPTDIYDKKWAYIRFVSVNPQFGGQGIGRRLTEKCIDLAKENKEETIALHTSEMMSKARRIYERLGFEILREIKPQLGKRYWLYKLDL